MKLKLLLPKFKSHITILISVIITLVSLLSLPIIAVGATDNSGNSSPSKIILVVGDSLSVAHNIDPDKGWVNLLQKRLQEKNLPYQVVNASESGETTSNGLSKLPELLEEYHPAIVILGLGSNDGLRGLSTVAMQKNISKMIDLSKNVHAKVLLIGFLIPVNYGPKYRTQFEQVFKNLSKQYGLPEVPFLLDKVALKPGYMLPDELHPNEKAQPILLDNVWVYLQPLLK